MQIKIFFATNVHRFVGLGTTECTKQANCQKPKVCFAFMSHHEMRARSCTRLAQVAQTRTRHAHRKICCRALGNMVHVQNVLLLCDFCHMKLFSHAKHTWLFLLTSKQKILFCHQAHLCFDVETRKWSWSIDFWLEGGIQRNIFKSQNGRQFNCNKIFRRKCIQWCN